MILFSAIKDRVFGTRYGEKYVRALECDRDFFKVQRDVAFRANASLVEENEILKKKTKDDFDKTMDNILSITKRTQEVLKDNERLRSENFLLKSNCYKDHPGYMLCGEEYIRINMYCTDHQADKHCVWNSRILCGTRACSFLERKTDIDVEEMK